VYRLQPEWPTACRRCRLKAVHQRLPCNGKIQIAKELFLPVNSRKMAALRVANFYMFTTAGAFWVNLIARIRRDLQGYFAFKRLV
jgi:hypothetical protein